MLCISCVTSMEGPLALFSKRKSTLREVKKLGPQASLELG